MKESFTKSQLYYISAECVFPCVTAGLFSHIKTEECTSTCYMRFACFVRCIPKHRVCLSSSDCPQYECVTVPRTCNKNLFEPACDTDGESHNNLCLLLQEGKTLAYMGECQVGNTRGVGVPGGTQNQIFSVGFIGC